MPPLIAALVVGAGLVASVQAARRLLRHLESGAENDRRHGVAPGPKDLGVLERDPATGVYRPARRG